MIDSSDDDDSSSSDYCDICNRDRFDQLDNLSSSSSEDDDAHVKLYHKFDIVKPAIETMFNKITHCDDLLKTSVCLYKNFIVKNEGRG